MSKNSFEFKKRSSVFVLEVKVAIRTSDLW